jgi:hypothetical protein
MTKAGILLFSTCVISVAMAEPIPTTIPAGTIIPIRLSHPLDAKRAQPGQIVQAKVAQNVPLYNGSKIKAGTELLGEVLSATPAQDSQPASIALRFDKLVSRKHKKESETLPLSADLRALASPEQVEQAEIPINEIEVEKQHFNLTTVQIGGDDIVYRGGGPVVSGREKVGKPIEGGSADLGVLSHLASSPGTPCRGPVAGNDHPQALWLFSHDACGVFGYHFTIARSPQNDAAGKIVLESHKGDLRIEQGSAMLLRVNSTAPADNLTQR